MFQQVGVVYRDVTVGVVYRDVTVGDVCSDVSVACCSFGLSRNGSKAVILTK